MTIPEFFAIVALSAIAGQQWSALEAGILDRGPKVITALIASTTLTALLWTMLHILGASWLVYPGIAQVVFVCFCCPIGVFAVAVFAPGSEVRPISNLLLSLYALGWYIFT